MLPALTIPAITLGLGLSANAYFFFGNLAETQVGSVSVISTTENRKKLGLSPGKTSQIFDDFYHKAAPQFALASVISATSYLSTAFLQRKSASLLSTQLLTAAGVLSLFPAPWTIFVMMPTNKRLMAKAKASAEGDTNVNNGSSEADIDRDIATWLKMNTLRFGVLGFSYSLALLNLLVY